MTRNRNHNRTAGIILYSKNTLPYSKCTKTVTDKRENGDFQYKI